MPRTYLPSFRDVYVFLCVSILQKENPIMWIKNCVFVFMSKKEMEFQDKVKSLPNQNLTFESTSRW